MMDLSTAIALIAALIGIVSAGVAITSAIRKGGSQSGTILTELGYIKASIEDIKRKEESSDVRYLEMRERISAAEASAKQAHRRLDEITGQRRPGGNA